MKHLLTLVLLFITVSLAFSQDLSMQDGTFNRCEPDKFFDSEGAAGTYSIDENYVITVCPQNPEDVSKLTLFRFRLNSIVIF